MGVQRHPWQVPERPNLLIIDVMGDDNLEGNFKVSTDIKQRDIDSNSPLSLTCESKFGCYRPASISQEQSLFVFSYDRASGLRIDPPSSSWLTKM